MNKFIKILLAFVLVLAIIGAIGYFSFMNAPKASVEDKKAEFTIAATALFEQFEADETASNTKYIGKTVEVSGTIGEISKDENDAPVLLLNAGEDGFGGVLCTLEGSQKEKASKLKMGQTIKVKGVCTGMLMEVIINKGTLIE